MDPIQSIGASRGWVTSVRHGISLGLAQLLEFVPTLLNALDNLFEQDYVEYDTAPAIQRYEGATVEIEDPEKLELLQGYDVSDVQTMFIGGSITAAQLARLQGVSGVAQLHLRGVNAFGSVRMLAHAMPDLQCLSLEDISLFPEHLKALDRVSRLEISAPKVPLARRLSEQFAVEQLRVLKLIDVGSVRRLTLDCPALHELTLVKCLRLVSIHGLGKSTRLKQISIEQAPLMMLPAEIGKCTKLAKMVLGAVPNLHCLPETMPGACVITLGGSCSSWLMDRLQAVKERVGFVLQGKDECVGMVPRRAAHRCLPPSIIEAAETCAHGLDVLRYLTSVSTQLQAQLSRKQIFALMEMIEAIHTAEDLGGDVFKADVLNYSEACFALLRCVSATNSELQQRVVPMVKECFATATVEDMLFARPADIARRVWVDKGFSTDCPLLDSMMHKSLPF